MKLAIFDTHQYDQESLEQANEGLGHELKFFKPCLSPETAALAAGYPAVCVFVHDQLDEATLAVLHEGGTKLVALRCAGFNNVDLKAAARLGIRVVRVPEYSPYAVAEHAMALLLALNRKLPRAYNRTRDGNFSLDGLVGFDLHGKTVGVVGLGRIGAAFARIAKGFGCRLLGYDVVVNEAVREEIALEYTSLDRVLREADIVSLHVPLFKETAHLINAQTLGKMKRGALLINASRGGLIDAVALLEAIKSGHLGGAALDVYEGEEELFFRDLSGQVLQDDVLARLLSCPNVMVTAHQAFLTQEALREIAQTTLGNVTAFEKKEPLRHVLAAA
ncbi:MAG: 2-hydroxyacid dehydrogenase [Verrucomicrobium sp.]|nr:2-hydroxyacid dehydrogenase [Verrucomicrobium sp.]